MTQTPGVSFDTAFEAYRKWIGWNDTFLITPQTIGYSRPTTREHITVASDFHIPFHHREALRALIDEEAAQTDLLVINGDLGDFWAHSRFPKSKRVVDPCDELRETQAVLALLAERFKRIVVVGGNHDARPAKYLMQMLPPEMLDWIQTTGPGVLKPLDFLCAGLDNVKVVEPIRSENAEFQFLYQHGDLVCAHAETFSKIPNRAATNVLHWIKAFAEPKEMFTQPIRCVVQAHTHQGGTVNADYGCLAIEGGCMSTLQDYHGNPKIMTPRPLATGWTRIIQIGGKTNFRESRFIPYARG